MERSQTKYGAAACLMDQALLQLLEKKDYDYITVKEICEKAGVNRSTFYLHYETIDDLLQESLTYIFSQFTDKYNSNMKIRPKSEALGELFLVTPAYILPYLEFLSENRRLFMAAVKKPAVFQVDRHIQEIMADTFDPILDRFQVDAGERKYLLAFYLSGMHAIIIEWIKGGCAQPAQYIAGLLVKYTPPYEKGSQR